MLRRPAKYIDGLQSQRRAVGFQVGGKPLEQDAVPLVGTRDSLSLRPFKEVVKELEHGDCGGVTFATRQHHLMKPMVGGVTVGAEVVLAAVDCDEPVVTVFTDESPERAEKFAMALR